MRFSMSLVLFLFFTNNLVGQSSRQFQDSIQYTIGAIDSDSLKAIEYYNAGIYAFQPLNNLKLSRLYADSALYYSRLINNQNFEATCHFLYGLIDRFEGNYDSAIKHLNKNLDHFRNKSINKPSSLYQIAAIYAEQGDYDNSLTVLYQILKIYEEEKDSFAMASVYNSMAVDYYEMGNIDQSLLYLQKAISIFTELDEKKDMANTTRNIGELYLSKHDTTTAIQFVETSLEIANEINENYEIGYSLYTLGSIYIKDQPQKALEYLQRAKMLIEQGNYKSLLTNIYISLGRYYQNAYKNTEAINYYKSALHLADELNELPPKKDIYESLSLLFKEQKDFKNAYTFQSLFIQVKDSLINSENLKTVSLLEKQYETEKKEKEIASLSEQKLIAQTRIAKQQQQLKWLIFCIIGVIVLAILLFLLWKQQTKNKRQSELIDTISETQYSERKRIARDLHDSIGGSLALIKNKLETFSTSSNFFEKDLKETIHTVAKTSDNVRRISHNLMPGELIKFGLVSGIQSILEQINNEELNAQLYAHNMDLRLDPVKEIQLYNITQEVIQNVLKHARAKNVTISLNKFAKHLNLMIEDDGRGFNDLKTINSNGIGLNNIKQRVMQLKGTFNIDTAPGRGTTFNIQIPV